MDKKKIIEESINKNNELINNIKESLIFTKNEDKKFMEEYSKALDEQELKRKLEYESIKRKVKNFTSQEFYSKFININDLMKRDLQIKNEKFMDEDNKKYIITYYKNKIFYSQ